MNLTKEQREAIEHAVRFMSKDVDLLGLRAKSIDTLRSLLAAPSADDAWMTQIEKIADQSNEAITALSEIKEAFDSAYLEHASEDQKERWRKAGLFHRINTLRMRISSCIHDISKAAEALLAVPTSSAENKPAAQPKLSVWYGPMPESNGKTNWTAILHRGDVVTGIVIDQSEYEHRVRFAADEMRFLIGEINEEPDILTYDADAHSGYVEPPRKSLQLTDERISEIAKSMPVGEMGVSLHDFARAILAAQDDPNPEFKLTEYERDDRDVWILDVAKKYGQRDPKTYEMLFDNANLFRFSYELLAEVGAFYRRMGEARARAQQRIASASASANVDQQDLRERRQARGTADKD
jgi:hypothetical protein